MILLDTHIVVWLAEGRRLSPSATRAIQKARSEGGLAICSVTLFEIAQLVARQRITLQSPVSSFLDELERRFIVKQITGPIATASVQFADPYPRDPMDRLIGATALVDGMKLVTADERIRDCKQLATVW